MNIDQRLRVAVIYTSLEQPVHLKSALEANNVEIASLEILSKHCLSTINIQETDVILVDLEENAEHQEDFLETIIDQSSLPVLFNESATTRFKLSTTRRRDWGKKLAQKLRALSNARTNDHATQATPPLLPEQSKVVNSQPNLVLNADVPIGDRPQNSVERVWVLAASLGGPAMVKEFLTELPNDLPIAFLLAQHIGASYIDLLAEQLDRATQWKVISAKEGLRVNYHEVILAPTNKRILIDDEGIIVFNAVTNSSVYAPSIDTIMQDIALQYGANSGAIIFSGMGNDGEAGCEIIAKHGGIVWAQDPNSCIISSMPDHARKTGNVSFTGTPKELANKLSTYLEFFIWGK